MTTMLRTVSPKRANALVALFFVALLALGLLTVMDYGPTWDQTGEVGILRMALMEYGELLPFETDFHAMLVERGTMRLSDSIERDHGTCLYYPLVFAVCNKSLSSAQVAWYWCAYTWLLFVGGLYALYAICRHMGLSRAISCLAVLFMVLSPRFFADGHYNNKDIGLLAITLVTMWQAVRLKERPTFGRAALFSVAAAFCMATRIIGVAVCALCGLLIVLDLLSRHALGGRVIWVGVFTLLLSVGLYLLLSPAFLAGPAAYLRYVVQNAYSFSRWNGKLLFMGSVIDLSQTKPPFYYLPVMMLCTTPVWLVCLTFVGQWRAVKQLVKERLALIHSKQGFVLALCSLLWLGALLGCVVMRVRVYNGWRHIYFLYGAVVVIAAYGFDGLWAHARRVSKRWTHGFALASALVLLCSGVLLAVNHPYQYAYYSPIVPRQTLAQSFDLDYWNVSIKNALEQLLATASPNEKLRLLPTDESTESGVAHAIDRLEAWNRFTVLPVGSEPAREDYIVANTTYAELAGFTPTGDMQPVVQVSSYGAIITTIYQKGEAQP